MAVKSGDFLLLNYTLKVKESGETVDTTFDTVAKDAGIHREEIPYGPKFIILGEGWLPRGLEDSLIGLDPGPQTTIELNPEKGYGVRDPGKIRLVSLRRFREKGIEPIPGAQVELDGRPAVVRAVGAGRVQVDYNHPFAGRTLIYDVSIDKILENPNEKILNIVSKRIPEVSKEKFSLRQENKSLAIEVPEEAFYLSGLQVAKKAIISDLQKHFPDIDRMTFLETFKKSDITPQEEPSKATTTTEPPVRALEEGSDVESSKPKVPINDPPRQKRPRTKSGKRRARAGSENQR